MAAFELAYDEQSLKELVQYAGFAALLSPEVQEAMGQGGDLIISAAQSNMHWMNPTGALEGSMHRTLDSPYEVWVGSDLPYAHRREVGFSGQTDSLGRYYANDPGQPYLAPALEQTDAEILGLLSDAVNRYLARIGRGW